MKIFSNKKLKTLYKIKIFFNLIFFATILSNIQPLVAMDDDDKRGTLIKYLKVNHPKAFEELNKCFIQDKFVNSTADWLASLVVNPTLRPVNSEDILFTASQAHVLGMTHALFHHAENAIYNITLKHSKNTAKELVDIFLKSNMSKEKLFTYLLEPGNLKKLLFNKLGEDDLKEDKPYNSSDLPFLFKGGLLFAQRFIFKENPEDHVSWMKEKAALFTEEYLMGPSRQAFSLEEIKKIAFVKVNEMIIKSMKIDKEAEDKNFPVFNKIIAPIFWEKGCDSSKSLILSLLHPIARKLDMKSEDLLREPEIPDPRKEKSWEEIIDPMKKAYEIINLVVPAKTAQVVKKIEETLCNDNCLPHNNKEAAIKCCSSEAYKGNADNSYARGCIDYHVHKNPIKAQHHFKEASEQGDIRAHTALKERYSLPPQPSIFTLNERVMILSEKGKALNAPGKGLFNKSVGKKTFHNSQQLWKIQQVNNKHYMIISDHFRRRALDCSESNHPFIVTEPLHESNHGDYRHQLWEITKAKGGWIIYSVSAEKALDSYKKDSGTVIKYPKHSSDHPDYKRQVWIIQPQS